MVRAVDEGPHPDVAVEAWWFWGADAGGAGGLFVGFEARGRRYDYWVGLVRPDEPFLLIEELDGADRRAGLEIKPAQMWADQVCDVPMQQWSVGNEAHGVLLDDPDEAWRRAHGTLVPVTFDVEWHAVAAPVAIERGYVQDGEIDARIELTEGVLALVGPARRVHVWGIPYVPDAYAMPVVETWRRAPYRRTDGRLVDQVLTTSGAWLGRCLAAP